MTDVGRDAALRALVDEWRKQANRSRTLAAEAFRKVMLMGGCDDTDEWVYKQDAIRWDACANELAALLASPAPVVGAVPDQTEVEEQ